MNETMSREDLLIRVSIKYAVISTVVYLIVMVIETITYNPEPKSGSFLVGLLSGIAFAVFLGLAHIEYNKKNGDFIFFKDAVLIGIIIIGIFSIVTGVFNFVNYELFLKEKTLRYYSERSTEGNLLPGNISVGFRVLGEFIALFVRVAMLFFLITLEAQWKIFKKAGRQGWESLVPIYNYVIFLKICQKPAWWIILMFIPIVDIFVGITVYNGLSKTFGKTEGFTAGLVFLPFIFFPLLGLSQLKYQSHLAIAESPA